MRADKLAEKLQELSAAHAQSGSGYGDYHSLRDALSLAATALQNYDRWHKARYGYPAKTPTP